MPTGFAIPDRPATSSAFPVMRDIATCLLRERMSKQLALQRIAGNDPCPDDIKVLARLFVIPGCGSRRKRLKTHGRARRMAGHASRVAFTLRQKDWLYLRLEVFKVKRR